MKQNEIKEEILQMFAKSSAPMTAKQIVAELHLEDEKQKVAQCLTLLKSSGVLTTNRNYCDEDDALRNFYEPATDADLPEPKVTPVCELPPVTPAEEKAMDEKQASNVVDHKPAPITKTVYQLEVNGEYVTEVEDLEQAKKQAETIASTEMEAVTITAVEIKTVGTVKPIVTTEFLAA